MISLSHVVNLVRLHAKENSASYLSVGAGIGVLSTAYLTAKASFKAARVIDHVESREGTHEDPKERLKERTKLVWKLYIPPALAATSTVVCIAGSNRISANKAAAAQTALAFTQSAYADYREKAIEEFGDQGHRKDESIRAKIAQERVDRTDNAVIVSEGNVLCFETENGRYFESSMETLKRAELEVNRRLNIHDYVTMDDFYYLVGLEETKNSNNLGWKAGRHLELYFASVLKGDKAAISFEYNYVTTL